MEIIRKYAITIVYLYFRYVHVSYYAKLLKKSQMKDQQD